mgnify:CR=1 FL=1
MKKIISINYQEMSEQAVARPQKAFLEMHDVIKMDCLNDAIYDLEEMRKKLDKKMDDKFQKKIKRIKK